MFERLFSRPRGERSVLGSRLQIRGTITSGGALEIRGRVEGDIEHSGRLVISSSGTCFSNIRADELQLAGEVRGNVAVEDLLELMPTARLYGDVACRSLRIHPGAIFLGTTHMPDAIPPAPAAPPLLSASAGPGQALQLTGPLAVLCEPITGAERRELLRNPVYEEALPDHDAAEALEIPTDLPMEEPPRPEPPTDRAPAFYGGFYPVPAAKGQG
jgi:cytoskeletal protein CcmA (bactofilin family)